MVLATPCLFSQQAPPEPEAQQISTTVDQVLADFDAAWQAVSESYVDKEFGGLDWEEMKNQYRPKVKEAADAKSAYELLREMLGKLGSENTRVIAPWERREYDLLLEYGGVGMLLTEDESGEVMVLQVFSGSPAEAAEVLVGDVIVGVDDWRVEGEDPLAQIVERVRGLAGTAVSLTLKDPDEVERTVQLTRAKIDLRPKVEQRIIEATTGYLRVPVFSEDLVGEGSRALPQLLNTRGLILDLRSISAGSVEAMVQVAQWFLGTGHLGGFYSREGAFAIPFREDAIAAYQRPLVVLINSRTYGLGEILAFVLKEYRRATLVGNKSDGGFEVARSLDLPSGGILQISVGRYLSPKGEFLPQEGIAPDVEVEAADIATLREGRDLYLEKAVEVLEERRQR